MRTTSLFALAATIVFFNFGCDPKNDPEKQDFSCIKIFDDNGVGLGLHGGCTTSQDWGKITLNASEQAFLNFSDTVSLEGTVATQITQINVYPCPVVIDASLAIIFGGDTPQTPVKLKLAIVDESLNVVWQFALQTKTSNGLQLYMDPSKFEPGKYYRMYYRISAEGVPSLYEGYGNFVVCKTHINGVTTTIEADCM